ncbi:protein Wnt-11b-2-like [Palaemon carinicauda]|uniref:protein Wnt-11b-2-like n=1 Tax=Palaemon carinicauda TaxID=392227 RepID=UPI0035B684B4
MISSIDWLSLYRGGSERWGHSRACRVARRVHGFTKSQTRTCRRQVEVMPHVTQAARSAIITCQRIFQKSRWNCSSILNAPYHTPDLTEGTREQAVVYALTSAAVTWSVSRACSQGTLILCGCGSVPQEPPNGQFKWGGCGDNIIFGARFARDFVDDKDEPKNSGSGKRKGRSRQRRWVTEKRATEIFWRNNVRHHREVQPYSPSTVEEEGGTVQKNTRRSRTKRRKKKQRLHKSSKSSKQNPVIAMMNQHNNRVGRRVVEASLSTQCKCHGVSGSCNIKTCWKALPNFLQAGARLYRKYLSGVEVREVLAGPRLRLLPASPAVSRFSRDDLIYATKSPDYCHPEPRVGSLGTRGRRCNITSRGVDGCEQMCCGRGHISQVIKYHQRCHCKYHWCCYVTCQTCAVWEDIHTCN